MSLCMTKATKWPVRPVMTQISLGILPVWSESSLGTQWVAEDPMFLHVDHKDPDQTGRMPRLIWVIWVFAGHTDHFVCFVMQLLNLVCQMFQLSLFLLLIRSGSTLIFCMEIQFFVFLFYDIHVLQIKKVSKSTWKLLWGIFGNFCII